MKNNLIESYDLSQTDNDRSRLSGSIIIVICVMLIISTIAYGAVDVWATGMLALFSGLIVLLWLADSFFKRRFLFSTDLIQLPLLGLILIGLIQLIPLGSANISPDLLSVPATTSLSLAPFATRLFVIQLIIYFIFLIANLIFINNIKRMRLMVFMIIVFSSLMAFFGIIQALTNTNPNSVLGIRENPDAFPFATFINRHHFAAFMNMTIGLTLGLLYGNATKSDKRLLLIISLVLMGIAMMFTGSRGGILSLLGVVAFVTLLNLAEKKVDQNFRNSENKVAGLQRKFILIGGGLMLLLILVGSAVFFGGETSVTRGLGLETQNTEVSGGRFHFWQTALQIIWHNPIFGAGLDAFGFAFTRYDTWNGSLRVEYAHNEYLHIFADAGILGFICLLAFIFLLFKKGLKVISQTEDRFRRGVTVGAMAGCFGILIHSFFDFPLRTSSNALFFLTLTALATVSIYVPELNHQKRPRRSPER